MDGQDCDTVGQRVEFVLAQIRLAAQAAGRRDESVRLVAATKTVPVSRIREAITAGLRFAGENRLQEALPKIDALAGEPITWHFIGRLQRRKAREVVGRFALIHSVDSLELADEIDKRAGAAGLQQEILLEINVGDEPTKGGFHPTQLHGALAHVSRLPHVRVKGLMAIPPPVADAEMARPYFRRLRDLARQAAERSIPSVSLDELSMGMSNDYLVAIQEGATLVRVGTALFGARHG